MLSWGQPKGKQKIVIWSREVRWQAIPERVALLYRESFLESTTICVSQTQERDIFPVNCGISIYLLWTENKLAEQAKLVSISDSFYGLEAP